MNRRLSIALLAIALAAGAAGCGDDGDEPAPSADSADTSASLNAKEPQSRSTGVLTGTLPLLNGEPRDLSGYSGKVVLVVNTASECGFTPQFDQLESLYESNRKRGFVILGFPADDIVGQEPRSNEQIAEFCKANFGVSFPMFAKSNVVDDPVNPLFVRLTETLGAPTYNFNKYLLDRDGRPVERYDQYTEPDDPALTTRIDQLLAS